MTQTDVLVVGAGPTGLTLACDLARRGVAVRIVDRAPEFPGGPRGKGLSPRSLEVFDDLAVIDRILASGITHLPHREYRGAGVIAEIDPEAGQAPTPDIPYPAGLMIPSGGEQILRERLADFDVAVEVGAEVRDFSQHADGVTATIGEAEFQARYLIGCDGGRSTVRRGLGLSLRGETPDVQLMAVVMSRLTGSAATPGTSGSPTTGRSCCARSPALTPFRCRHRMSSTRTVHR